MLTRGAVMAEDTPGGFAAVYPVLAALEERGAARRGYFVEGLGAAQFAVPGAVDRLRGPRRPRPRRRADRAAGRSCWPPPTRPTRTARRCPGRSGSVEEGEPGTGHRPGRKAGALVVTVGGELVLYVERGGRTLLSYVDDPAALAGGRAAPWPARSAAAPWARCRWSGPTARPSTPPRWATRSTAAGFRATPRGLRLRA